jgi:hypothetical protein
MTIKSKPNKIEIDALLNTYSVKEIIEMFATIDEKIMSLHTCSSDDFLMLNSSFKDIYQLAKGIDSNVTSTLGDLDKINISQSLESLIDVNKKIKIANKEAALIDNQIVKLLENLLNKTRLVFIPLKNHGQNLMSLKLLITNLKFYDSTDIEVIPDLIDFILISERLLFKSKTLTERNFREINNLRKKTKNCIANFKILLKSKSDINAIIDEETAKTIQLLRKMEKLLNHKPVLKKRCDDLNNNVEYIVTNLQYQDIIRQKMEHIQQTHKDFLQELDTFDKSFTENHLVNEKAKQFVRIRDISGLHAAKLLQTNKEYQGAIEIIIRKFLKISDNISKNSLLFQSIGIQPTNSSEEFTKISNLLENCKTKQKQVFNELNGLFREYNRELINANQLDTLEKDIHKHFTQNIERLQNFYPDKENTKNHLKQLTQYIHDLKLNSEHLNKHFAPIFKLKEEFNSANLKIQNFKKLRDLYVYTTNANNKITTNSSPIIEKIVDNEKSNIELVNCIKKATSSVKYYGFFDNTISEIINILGSINLRLKNSYSGTIEMEKEKLNQLKEYYTMDIEYKIHDRVLNTKTEKKTNESLDKEIEFF